MKQLIAPQNSLARKKNAAVQPEESYSAEFEGSVKSPVQKFFDAGKAVVADYKRYEDKMTHIEAPIIYWLIWTVLCITFGAIVGYLNH